MAKGVLAARGVNQTPHPGDADRSNAVLRQLHDVVDSIARIWPSLQGATAQWPGPLASAATTGREPEPLPNVKPAAAIRPGQRGTISMMLCNKESRPVRLTPLSTDLISSTGGRIAWQLLEFVPGDLRLEPGEQKEVQGRIAVPIECAVGRYMGILTVIGVDYLRALITVDVV